jgi:mRNA interferase RelE/StbE
VNIKYQKRFLKELARIPSKRREQIEQFVFEEVLGMDSLFESAKVEQMTGYPGFYKVRFGDYRIGIRIKDDTVSFERALHRKDIYRFFP